MIPAITIFSVFVLAAVLLLLKQRDANQEQRTFSILIACRDEEDNIPGLITSLSKINYPQNMFQVIIVDDASSDNTWQLLLKHTASLPNFQVYRLPEKSAEYKGKKAALKLAAEQAEYDYLLYTDADCLLPGDILNSYSSLLIDGIDAVIGWYITKNATPVQRIIDISSGVTFALTSRLGMPFSASGMNWVLRREAFFEVGGYEKIKDKIAGDDKLLLLLVKTLGRKIIFNHRCPVETVLPAGANTQRLLRKYGKFASSPPAIKLSMLLIFAFYIYLPCQMVGQGFEIGYIYLSGLLLLWMIVLLHFKLKFKFTDPIILVILPYLIGYFVLRGSLGNWEWKGQKQKES
ncbi:MAG: glycosyltransferase [Candidatus Cloacimonetes bacterium]|nr:glycosyltransferase [Candidatus Cloacimonadota bacterium]